MAERQERPQSLPEQSQAESEYDRFESLTRRLLSVPKDELREAEAREREHRTA